MLWGLGRGEAWGKDKSMIRDQSVICTVFRLIGINRTRQSSIPQACSRMSDKLTAGIKAGNSPDSGFVGSHVLPFGGTRTYNGQFAGPYYLVEDHRDQGNGASEHSKFPFLSIVHFERSPVYIVGVGHLPAV